MVRKYIKQKLINILKASDMFENNCVENKQPPIKDAIIFEAVGFIGIYSDICGFKMKKADLERSA